jgi:hypothetical protein
MDGHTATVLQMLIAFGSFFGTIAVWRFTGGRSKAKEADLKISQAQTQVQVLRIADLEKQNEYLHRQNEQLNKQIEWHSRLLETQDQIAQRLISGPPATTAATTERVPVR